MAYLEFNTPKGPRRVEVRDKPVTIGRSAGNSLAFNDERMSRHHAVVERREEQFFVRDLGSRNGTALNSSLVEDEAAIKNGDVLKVGSCTFRFFTQAPPKAQVPAQKASNVIGSKPVDELLQVAVADDGPPDLGLLDEPPARQPQQQPAPKWEMPTAGEADGVAPARALMQLAESLPFKPFDASDIELINSRGQVVHATNNDKEIPAEAVIILRLVLLCCFRTRASDIHVEPKGDSYLIRIRADGSMVTIAKLTKDLGVRFLSVVKILCDIDISVRNAVQEGNFVSRVPDRKVDYRVSMTPSIFGQKLVVRCLDSANAPRYLWDLNLPEQMFRTIEKAIKRDAGMLLVCGPTGSGKTSTLYSVLRSIDASERNVVTIEDPVEIQIEGGTQMPVNDEAGSTFAALLRSTLRQDPDVILVGEIRDAETAKTAMQAAMTGHLVFSTVHSKDTPGSVFRLLDLGIEPFLVASGLNLLVAQRLIRTLCPFCKQAAAPTEEQLREMGPAYENLEKIYRATGCIKCLGTGYSGRRGVFELLVVDDNVRAAIAKNNQGEVMAALHANRFVSLRMHGFQLAAEGVTTFDEVDRVLGD
jgi:general secretion pathway protein E